MASYSYSSIKTFQQCPKKYYETKVLKKYKQEKTEAIIYGEEVHLALELYVKEDTPLGKHDRFKATADMFMAMDGEKVTELKMAVNKDLEPVDFFASDVWFRGIADLSIINGDQARVFDYKTGSAKYPDKEQLEIMALLIFAHFTAVNYVRAALVFLLYDSVVPKQGEMYNRLQFHTLWAKWEAKINEIEAASESGVWNMKASALCPWCEVTTCINWKPKRNK
jgi:RecB family exonuclease